MHANSRAVGDKTVSYELPRKGVASTCGEENMRSVCANGIAVGFRSPRKPATHASPRLGGGKAVSFTLPRRGAASVYGEESVCAMSCHGNTVDFRSLPRTAQKNQTANIKGYNHLGMFAIENCRERDVRVIARESRVKLLTDTSSSETSAASPAVTRMRPSQASPSNADDDYGFLSRVERVQGSESFLSGGVACADTDLSCGVANATSPNQAREGGESALTWQYDNVAKAWTRSGGAMHSLEGSAPIVKLSLKECRVLRQICLVRIQSLGLDCLQVKSGDNDWNLKRDPLQSSSLASILRKVKRNYQLSKQDAAGSVSRVFGLALREVLVNDHNAVQPPLASSKDTSLRSRNPAHADLPFLTSVPCGRQDLLPHSVLIPKAVSSYFRYLEHHGMTTVGLFRIGSSRRRVVRLHEELDSSQAVRMEDGHNPHDVASILKEFFRKLPDALLCSRLYKAFLSTRKIQDKATRLMALRYLVVLLPIANRDLLYALLCFLSMVCAHSETKVDEHGTSVQGNKMTSHNLAAIFGPNILHSGKHAVELQSICSVKEVVEVVKEMIDNTREIFLVTKELHDSVLQTVMEMDPIGANFILSYRFSLHKELQRQSLETTSHSTSISSANNSLLPKFEEQKGSLSSGSTPTSKLTSNSANSPCVFDSGNYVELLPPRLHLRSLAFSRSAGICHSSAPTPLMMPSCFYSTHHFQSHCVHQLASDDPSWIPKSLPVIIATSLQLENLSPTIDRASCRDMSSDKVHGSTESKCSQLPRQLAQGSHNVRQQASFHKIQATLV